MPEDHRHPGVRELVGDVPSLVRPQRVEIEVGDLRATEVLEREDARRRVLLDDARDDDPFVASRSCGRSLGVPRLVPVVELEPDRARELVDELLRVHELERLHALLEESRSLVQQAEVGLDLARPRPAAAPSPRPRARREGRRDGPDRSTRTRCGAKSNSRNARSIRRSSSASTASRTCSNGIGDASSWSPRSSTTMSGGTTSGRVERSCPNFTNVGPSSSSIIAQAPAAIRGGPGVAVRVAGDEIAEPVPAEEVAEAVSRSDLCDLGEAPEVSRRAILRRRHRRDCRPDHGERRRGRRPQKRHHDHPAQAPRPRSGRASGSSRSGLRVSGFPICAGNSVALEQLHAVLELSDPEFEVAHRPPATRRRAPMQRAPPCCRPSRRGAPPRGASCRPRRR